MCRRSSPAPSDQSRRLGTDQPLHHASSLHREALEGPTLSRPLQPVAPRRTDRSGRASLGTSRLSLHTLTPRSATRRLDRCSGEGTPDPRSRLHRSPRRGRETPRQYRDARALGTTDRSRPYETLHWRPIPIEVSDEGSYLRAPKSNQRPRTLDVYHPLTSRRPSGPLLRRISLELSPAMLWLSPETFEPSPTN